MVVLYVGVVDRRPTLVSFGPFIPYYLSEYS